MNFVCLEEEGDARGEEKERISEREEEGPQTHLKFPPRVSLECKVGSKVSQEGSCRDFPRNTGVEPPHFHCRGHKFSPLLGK